MKVLQGEEYSIFRIAMNREENICKKLDEKTAGYYTSIVNAIEEKIDAAVPRAAVEKALEELRHKSYESELGSRIVDFADVISILEGL